MPRISSAATSWAAIWKLTWPQAIMMFAHFSVGFMDVLVAGRISSPAQAALGLATQSLFVLLIVAIGLSNGVVASVSQSLGSGRRRRAARYGVLSLSASLGVGVLVMAGMLPWEEAFLELVRAPEVIRADALAILRIYLFTLPMWHLLVVSNALFRAYKEVYTPLGCMLLVAVVNGAGDLALGLGWWGFPAMGAAGLGWATFVSVSLGALCSLLVLWRKGRLGRGSWPGRRWLRAAGGYLARVSWPAGATQVVWQVGNLALFAVAGALASGELALAGMGAGQRVESILFLPAFACNMTASVLVGHHLGAGDFPGARRVGLRVLGFGVCVIGVMGLGLWQVAPEVAALVSPDAGAREEVLGYLFWNVAGIAFTTGSMILAGIMTGAGATRYNLIIFALATWGVRLPLAWGLAHGLDWGSRGVYIAMFASQGVQSGSLFLLFLRRDWGRFAMRPPARDCRAGTTS